MNELAHHTTRHLENTSPVARQGKEAAKVGIQART